jgi:hypothetical protein
MISQETAGIPPLLRDYINYSITLNKSVNSNKEYQYDLERFLKYLKCISLGKKEIDFALVFTNLKDSSIHTHFMRTEIDVYFLDENKIVFEKTSLKPWKFHRPKKQAKYILETKKDELKIKIGDKLDFI